MVMLMMMVNMTNDQDHDDADDQEDDGPDGDNQEEEGAFAPELGTGVGGQLGLQSKGEKGGQVLLNSQSQQTFHSDPPSRGLQGRLVQEGTREIKESVGSLDQKGQRGPGARLDTWERRGGQGRLEAQEAMEYQGCREQMADRD